MKRKFLSMLLATSLLCPAVTVSAAEYDTGTPWIYSGLEGNITQDTNVSLKDDFAAAVNKEWYLSNTIPVGYSSYSNLAEKAYTMPDEFIAILTDESLKNDPNGQITQEMYRMWLDWDTRNALGMEPVMPYLNAIRNIQTMDDLQEYLTVKGGINSLAALFPIGIQADMKNATEYGVYISSPSLFLGDSEEYRNPSEYGARKKALQEELAIKLLIKAGFAQNEATQIMKNCFAFEEMMAGSILTFEEQSQTDYIDRMYNPCTMEFLREQQGDMPIAEIIEVNGYDKAPNIVLAEPEWFMAFRDMYKQENLELIKSYLLAHSIMSVCDVLDQECYDWLNEMSNELNGSQGRLRDEVLAADFVSGWLSEPLAQLYCEKYYTEEDKVRIEAVCYDVIDEYKEMVMEEDFLTEVTKLTAIEKLDNMTVRAVYPDTWDDYSSITAADIVKSGNLLGAVMMIANYQSEILVAQLDKEIDKEEWIAAPTDVNAYYSSQDNSINIMAGILAGPVYRNDMSIEEIYAGVGSVIGHEISHGFDPTGSQFDKDGNYNNWWTDEDRAAFDNKTEKLIAYYDSIELWDGMSCNGSILQGEAIADLGGAACILRMAEEIEGFDYDKYFRSYAKVWANLTTPQIASYYALYDTHPADYLRINVVVSQFDEFQQTYGITEGDGMYVKPEDRITVW